MVNLIEFQNAMDPACIGKPVTLRLFRNKGKETAIPSRTDNVRSIPKLRRAEGNKLERMVLFGISGSVSEGMEEKFASNKEDGRTRLSLKAVPNAMEFLKRVLEAETPLEAIGRCAAQNIDVSTYHGQFLAIMLGTLQEFCIMRMTKPSFQYTDNDERTYWVESVIPMFRYLGMITDLVSFNR
ncbi:hypothetical protein K450DRAFT_200828 [Umbelopsis ramanniana AG]|uniref:Uncharacterized protein n=1 Tax=Umbelopsis ramanniana AG TaxID=1314678 RepID=A0AAD5E5P7_UMBRA|nr:uncharacterized protein K450DRAFT_200828 [Umbelopsis ramanniana AG]KAI8577933.1 hypothetical protein K450DRAFT_200828 [Umbelopsis ramanniana AG]